MESRCKNWPLIWKEIDYGIVGSDKLILIAASQFLICPAVNREIERAIIQEDDRGIKWLDKDVLFPIKLDDFIFTK